MDTSVLFHTCIKLKYDISQVRSCLVKPTCQCIPVLPHDNVFWHACDDAFNKQNDVVSLLLQILCESNDCVCLDNMYSFIDHMNQSVNTFLAVMSSCAQYLQCCGNVGALVDCDILSFCSLHVELSQTLMYKFCNILKQCDFNHCMSLYNPQHACCNACT